MANGTFMDKIRTFLGMKQEPPRNDFRNPIWSSDDEDDGDELYNRQQIDVYSDPMDLHREFTKQIHDIFKSFGSMFGDMKSFLHDDHFDDFAAITDKTTEPDNFNSNNIRDYYLKPGYHHPIRKHDQPKEDIDLDGKISSNEISGLLKQKGDGQNSVVPFNGNLVPGRSFCQTIITTSVTKPDGTVETRRIVKNGNEVVEETITSTSTSSGTDSRGPHNPGLDSMSNSGLIYNHVMSELSSLFRNFY